MLIPHVVRRPWAISTETAETIRQILEGEGFTGLRRLAEFHRAARPHAISAEAAERGFELRTIALEAGPARQGGGRPSSGVVAVIPVFGVLTQRGDIVDSVQTTSTAGVAAAVQAAVGEPAVDAVLLEFDTPGGEVHGVTEAAAVLREARASKPIVAVANSSALSAGYWLFAQADEGFVTPSGEVGSIGVYGAHIDVSKQLEAEGKKVTLVYAGKYKVEGNQYAPLTDEALATLQSHVDRHFAMFEPDVAKGRKVPVDQVRSDFGQGRTVGAKQAVAAGMADEVGTIDEALRRAAVLGAERKRGAASLAAAKATLARL